MWGLRECLWYSSRLHRQRWEAIQTKSQDGRPLLSPAVAALEDFGKTSIQQPKPPTTPQQLIRGKKVRQLFGFRGRRLASAAVILLLLSLTLQSVRASVDLKPVIEGPRKVEVGETASFNAANSGGPIVNYTWDFRDGSFAFGPIAEHSFQRQGIYLIGLTLLGANGHETVGTHLVKVANTPPVAVAGNDVEIPEDIPLVLDAFASFDSTLDSPSLSYSWTLGDGRFASGETAVVSYPNAGTYRVVLRVTDLHGAFDVDGMVVTVFNQPPTAGAGIDIAVSEDQEVALDGTASTDSPSDIPTLAYSWDLGDGTLASGPKVVHRYPRAGTYEVNLAVTDDNGAISIDSLRVVVLNRPPEAQSLPVLEVDQGSTLLLTANSSDDPTDYPKLRYLWNGERGGREATLSWGQPGDYALRLQVVDEDNAMVERDTSVHVRNVKPTVSISDAYVLVDLEAYLGGESGNQVRLELLRGDLLEEFVILERGKVDPGVPPNSSRASIYAWTISGALGRPTYHERVIPMMDRIP